MSTKREGPSRDVPSFEGCVTLALRTFCGERERDGKSTDRSTGRQTGRKRDIRTLRQVESLKKKIILINKMAAKKKDEEEKMHFDS